jgi:amino acid adenylation domain-containing protein
MIVGLLGIVKAGGAYVPLDPGYPGERLSFMLADTQAPVLLTQQSLVGGLPDYRGRVVCLDRDWAAIGQGAEGNPIEEVTAENLVYIMYTSGSTGRPKGVCITHRNVVCLVKGADYVELSGEEVFLQFAPISFDAATLEIWGPLLNGGRLVVFPAHKPSLAELGQVIQRYGVTTLWLTAGLFHQMVENQLDSLKAIRHLLAGGDVLSVVHVRRVLRELSGCQLTNGYGPTENTTFTTCYRMTEPGQVGVSVSIGRPIANTQVYILDCQLRPVPIGVAGELYIGGDGLARGYLNQAEFTAEKFIKHPFSSESGARLYKSGDMVRYLADGNIEFLGRVDHQVKVRGFRVEVGEIEAVLGQHSAVREVVVLAREDTVGEKRLVAYIIADQEQPPTVSELRGYLGERVPDYMVPSVFMFLAMLPLTPNGKVDRRALPAPEMVKPELGERFVAPRTPVEEALAEIWAQVLRLEGVGVHDNFFDLGGHSLLATQVISRLRDRFQLEIPLRYVFEFPTVAKLADAIKKAQDDHTEFQVSTIVPISRKAHRMKRSTGGTLG